MRLITCLFCLLLTRAVYAQPHSSHGNLVVTPNGHYLQFKDGKPFFWLGDTAWELFHRLNLTEIKQYLDNRAAKGFNVIQAVALAEFGGLTVPNQYGELPLKNTNPATPNDRYFTVIDSTLHMARERNLFIGLLPTWGDKVSGMWGEGPIIFDTTNAYTYGKWLANRYKNEPNIIWILGGDRPAVSDSGDKRPVWRAMAKGITEVTGTQSLITYHPWAGGHSSSQYLHKEPWLDVNMFQSGHANGSDATNWKYVHRDFNYSPTKPTLDGEPNYEDHPIKPWPKWDPANGYYRDYDVRKQAYRSVFAGACGVTYGHHAIWQFMSAREATINHPDRGWINAMDRPGAFQVGHLRRLIESRPMLNRIPDNSIVVKGQSDKPAEHIEAFYDEGKSFAMIYLPVGKTISVNTNIIRGKLNAWWFNPKNASSHQIKLPNKKGIMEFTSPTSGVDNDWVLVIDNASKNYKSTPKNN